MMSTMLPISHSALVISVVCYFRYMSKFDVLSYEFPCISIKLQISILLKVLTGS